MENAGHHTLLSALRDIDGVLGGFLIDSDGHVIARDVPLLFGDALPQAAEHLARLRSALESEGGMLAGCVARFGEHLLILRSAEDQTLCVLCPRGTNVPAVQMGCTLVTRRLWSARRQAADAELADDSPSSARRFRGRKL